MALCPAHLLVFQKATYDLVGAISSKFSNTLWQTDCVADGISLGTVVVAGPSVAFSFLTCKLYTIGPFLAFAGM